MTACEELAVTNVQRIETGRHLFGGDSGRTPPSFITLDGLRRQGWQQIPAGWLLGSSRPLTNGQIADARQAAADAGLAIEVGKRILQREDDGHRDGRRRDPGARHPGDDRWPDPQRERRRPPHSGRDRGDLRIRRTITASTAGALALLGALLGVAGAYVMLTALYYDDRLPE